jgi:hypothetical protein
MSEADRLKEQIGVWKDTAALANEKIAELTAMLETTGLPPMPPQSAMLAVRVRFYNNPNDYQFLIKHVPFKGYYTTGTLPENSFFPSWEKLWAYFNSPDVVYRTNMVEVKESSFSWGAGVDRR